MAETTAIMAVQTKLARKMTAGAVLIGDMTAEIPEAFTTGAGATFQIPEGFKSIGLVSRENAPTFTPETETSDVDSWGLIEASRTDIVKRTTTIAWTGQETHKRNLELYHNVDLSAVTADPVTGEVAFTDPTSPDITYHRAIFVGIDGSGENAVYIIKIVPMLSITEVAEQQWSAESAVEYGFTARAKIDEAHGYAVKTVIAGPGWKRIAAAAGFAGVTP